MTFIFCWIATAWESPAHTRIAAHLRGQYLRGEKVQQLKQEGPPEVQPMSDKKKQNRDRSTTRTPKAVQLNLKDVSKVQDIISMFENLAN